MSGDEPQPPATAKDKGAAAAIQAEGADGALGSEFDAPLYADYDPDVPSVAKRKACGFEGLEPPPTAKPKGAASGAAAPNVEPTQPAKAKRQI